MGLTHSLTWKVHINKDGAVSPQKDLVLPIDTPLFTTKQLIESHGMQHIEDTEDSYICGDKYAKVELTGVDTYNNVVSVIGNDRNLINHKNLLLIINITNERAIPAKYKPKQ